MTNSSLLTLIHGAWVGLKLNDGDSLGPGEGGSDGDGDGAGLGAPVGGPVVGA